MDCVATSKKLVDGLRKRLPTGLRRPKKIVEGIGEVEKVRTERCHSWQLTLRLVPNRVTTVDDVLRFDDQDDSVAQRFVDQLKAREKGLRRAFIEQNYQVEGSGGEGAPTMEDVLENLDLWMAPFLVTRLSEGCYIEYDCADAPERALLGQGQFNLWFDEDFEIKRIDRRSEVSPDHRIDAFKSRDIPPGCGYVEDCVADRIICSGYVSAQPSLVEPLDESIQQVRQLLEAAGDDVNRTFLRAALAELIETKDEWARP